MEGNVTWPQAIFIIGLLSATTLAGFLAAWRMQTLRSKDRYETRQHFEARMTVISDAFISNVDALKARIATIENFNAGTMVVLKHLDEFRIEVKQQYEKLVEQREEDMAELHKRLHAIHNLGRLERINNEEAMKGP